MTITNGFADPELASLVRDHYTDPPFVGMPRWLIRRVLAACANSPFFMLLILRVQGEFAGLMLAQTVGDRPWRTVFRQSSLLLAVGAILVTGKRLRSLFRRRSDAITSQTPETSMLAECLKEAQSTRVKVEFIFIDPRFRGMRLAAALLRRLEVEMVQRRVEVGVAHIAAHNVASKAAFASAGWSVSPSAPGSLRAVKRFDPPAN